MKYLITGSKGFIGKNMLNYLSNENVITIDDDIFNSNDWFINLKDFLNFHVPDVIFHIGACSDTLETNVNFMLVRNYESTKILTDWAKENNKILIYSSSAANYGDNNKYPSNLYGWSKYVSEDYVILNGFIALRYFNVYGPHEEHKNKMSSIIYQAYNFNKKEPNKYFKLFLGKPKRDFIYVDDIIFANIFAFENFSNLKGKYYEVGFGESRTFEDILNILNIKYEYHLENLIPKGYQFYTCSSFDKWMPNWKPKYNLEMGIEKYLLYLKYDSENRSPC